MMFTQNEERVLGWLRTHTECGLVELATHCDMARSSAHTAIAHLLDMEVVQNVRPGGRAKYRIADRDAIERAATKLLGNFRAAVTPDVSSNHRPRLVFTDCYTLPAEFLGTLGGYYDITTAPDHGALHNAAEFAERTMDAEVIVRYDASPIDREFLQARPLLKGVVLPTCFVINVDLQACKDFGVIVKHADSVTQKYFSSTHVEFAIHATLTLLNPLRPSYDLNNYHWHTDLGGELFGRNVGLVAGNSNIRSLVEIFQAFGCTVRAASTAATPPMPSEFGLIAYRDVSELWQWSDVFIALDGAQPDFDSLLQGGPGPDYLINLSTMTQLNSDLALAALDSGRLQGLAQDVVPFSWNTMMTSQEMHDSFQRLAENSKVLLTPEMAILTEDSINRNYAQTFELLMALRSEI